MATLTWTKTLISENVMGCEKVMLWKFQSDGGDYVTGGITVTPASLGLSTIDYVNFMYDGAVTDDKPYLVFPNLANNKWLLFGTGAADDAPLGEAAAVAVDSSFIFRAQVFGVA